MAAAWFSSSIVGTSTGSAARQQLLVVEDARVVGDLAVAPSSITTTCLTVSKRVDQRPQQLQQRAVGEDDLVLGVVGDVDDVAPGTGGCSACAARGRCTARRSRARGGARCSRRTCRRGRRPEIPSVVEHAGQPARALRPTRRRWCARSRRASTVTIPLSREQPLGTVEHVRQRQRIRRHQALHGGHSSSVGTRGEVAEPAPRSRGEGET